MRCPELRPLLWPDFLPRRASQHRECARFCEGGAQKWIRSWQLGNSAADRAYSHMQLVLLICRADSARSGPCCLVQAVGLVEGWPCRLPMRQGRSRSLRPIGCTPPRSATPRIRSFMASATTRTFMDTTTSETNPTVCQAESMLGRHCMRSCPRTRPLVVRAQPPSNPTVCQRGNRLM